MKRKFNLSKTKLKKFDAFNRYLIHLSGFSQSSNVKILHSFMYICTGCFQHGCFNSLTFKMLLITSINNDFLILTTMNHYRKNISQRKFHKKLRQAENIFVLTTFYQHFLSLTIIKMCVHEVLL